MKSTLCIPLLLLSVITAEARTLDVGAGLEFMSLQTAAMAAQPGDTILLHAGVYSGGDYIENLQGVPSAWITVRAADNAEVIYRGGSQAFHLTDPAYVRIEGLIFEQQTENGVNIDDGGSYETPAHYVLIENCEWRSMNATGNNDELKLSGLDNFAIRNCRFTNGSTGGSLIDMVGCHNGSIEENHFENGGSNCIQAKGGTKDITIFSNTFSNGGERAINIGGSTGLQFFRPLDANYEASNIYAYSNIFSGATAPIAYVGAVNCEVVNNTIIRPTRWAIRILQETTEPDFLPCGNNIFRNNIVVFATTGQPAINIGTNTAPETFTFSNNLWFNPDDPAWSGPNTPVTEPDRILNLDPQFADTLYYLKSSSPAIGKGYDVLQPERDFYGRLFPRPRSIGAVEYGVSSVAIPPVSGALLAPNPAQNSITIHLDSGRTSFAVISSLLGSILWQGNVTSIVTIDIGSWQSGIYIFRAEDTSQLFIKY